MSDIDNTIHALLEALQFSPTNIRLRKHIAEMLMQAGRYSEAIEQWREVYQQTEDPDSALSLSEAYYKNNQFIEAKKTLKPFLTAKSTADSYLLFSHICYELGDDQEAGDAYQKAIERDQELSDPEYLVQLLARGAQVPQKILVEGDHEDFMPEDIVERPKITFQQVGGLEAVKDQIKMNIVYPFQQPALFKSFGKKVGGGLLMYGPPGCGKTYLARATAGECQAHFISISIHDVLDMYIGNSEKNLHNIFELARHHTPTIIFIDELDALGASRQQMLHHHGRMLTNQLLTELDGIDSNNSEVLVLGATNSPWFVDASLRRPGRFDRILFVPPPDLEARIEILQLHLLGKPIDAIDYARVARPMERYSGADIQAVCSIAAERVITQVMKSGKMRPIRTEDLLEALKVCKPSTLEWLATAKNYATYSNGANAYDDILAYLKKIR
ncbi:AAA family ATPase [Tengunoibacter tsumagoiensis]|uniref:Cell division cycle protein 48 n=1 Tax=Tengunoibacter tsumagoiensis TaxID=2014871 RepID=A0A402AAL9_9CHLR|nr:AAA family ATPase [Tengunoibacter tsumagoiensis]GCE16170.1 cell division cycle protein 48 [Tengunoibacter tsumagoiensis]